MTELDLVKSKIKDVPDFPKKGITFKDITPALQDARSFQAIISLMAKAVDPEVTHLAGIESRGFIFAAALAQKLDRGLVLVRKPGKLPRETYSQSYQLEYGEDQLHLHRDALNEQDRVMIIDDVLATGGTAEAVEKLCHQSGCSVAGFVFLMSLEFLGGAKKLKAPIHSLVPLN